MGAYLPAVFEEVLDLVDAVILTEKVCAWAWEGKLATFRKADKDSHHPYGH